MSDGGSITIGNVSVRHDGHGLVAVQDRSTHHQTLLNATDVLALAAVLQRYGEQMVEVEKAYRRQQR